MNDFLDDFMRLSVGFDKILDNVLTAKSPTYPPYDIIEMLDSRTEDSRVYNIVMALAGFEIEDLDITVDGDYLTVSTIPEEKPSEETEAPEDNIRYLYNGIAKRAFSRRFTLGKDTNVTQAFMKNGLLHIVLRKDEPKKIDIQKIEVQQLT